MTALSRSRQELDAARLLADGDFAAQAISRAYYAAFFAAEQALASLGESRPKHSGVIAAFGKLVIREGGLDEQIGRVLRSLFEQRNDVDYGEAVATREDAERAIRDAERFSDAVASWLAGTQRSRG
ncbi:MAG: HEPN domain-containing protein [Gaiellaceae bacterium]